MTDTEVRITSSSGAQKGSKLARYDLIPADALKQLAELFGRGAEKYAERNWEAGLDWSLNFAALQRHAWQFWNGEDFDEETGAAHMTSVAWHALALVEYMTTHPEFDNRPTTVNAPKPKKLAARAPRVWGGCQAKAVPQQVMVIDVEGDTWGYASGGWRIKNPDTDTFTNTYCAWLPEDIAPYTEILDPE